MQYFAYSLDLDRDDLSRFCAARKFPMPALMNERLAHLPGYRLVFNHFSPARMAGTANVEATGNPEDRVWGALYEVPEPYLKILDLREGTSGAYERRVVTVVPDEGKPVTDAVTYALAPGREVSTPVPPLPATMALIIKNGRRLGFPPEYLKFLSQVPLKRG